jgi:LemA protein
MCAGKWANIESALQRRADLIPNLMTAAQTAGVQEQEVFGQISEARSRLLNAQQAQPAGADGDRTPEQREAIINAANSFGGTIGRLLSLQESYPQLRSSEAFMKVQDELSGTENRINTARTDYNTAGSGIQHDSQFVSRGHNGRPARV